MQTKIVCASVHLFANLKIQTWVLSLKVKLLSNDLINSPRIGCKSVRSTTISVVELQGNSDSGSERERLLLVTFQTSFYGSFDFLGN